MIESVLFKITFKKLKPIDSFHTFESVNLILAILPNIAIHRMDFATRSMKTLSTCITRRTLEKYTVSAPIIRIIHLTNFLLTGLVFDLNVDASDLGALTDRAGFRLVIHDNDESAMPQEDGLYIDPGFITEISLRVVKIFVKTISPF